MLARSSLLSRQPWIYRPGADAVFILLPAFLATAVVLAFPRFFADGAAMPPWFWLVFIVGIDVAHVYSTLWRTYFDPEEFQKYRRPLLLIPLLSFVVGAGLYLLDGMLFWRILAYLAVFHFIRQQYGFFSLYARKENRSLAERRLDAAVIYAATLYPLIYWHTHLPRNFNWFIEGDFGTLNLPGLSRAAGIIYGILIAIYLTKEISKVSRHGHLNLPKNLILLGTAVSWYFGIVVANGDLAFTATNVVAHGIPYMALVWMYERKKENRPASAEVRRPHWLRRVFRVQYLPVFVGALLLFAYLEEALWDALVWRDHAGLFPWAESLPHLDQAGWLAVVVPLLATPQVTHYLIDGFIWKMRKPSGDLRNV
ncbi:MAG: hypothetical protein AAGN35_25090 [Bacteroidota bacterium]